MLDKLKSILGSLAPAIASVLGGPLASIAVGFLGDKLLGNKNSNIVDIIAAVKDPNAAVKLKELDKEFALIDLEAAKLISAENLAQIEVNKIVATQGFWDSGWRSALGWLGFLALLNETILMPYLAAFGIVIPHVDINLLYGVLTVLIGARSLDKWKGK